MTGVICENHGVREIDIDDCKIMQDVGIRIINSTCPRAQTVQTPLQIPEQKDSALKPVVL